MNIPNLPPVILFIIFIWSLFWKGLALWSAAKSSQKNWFIVLLVINTVGLLEIAYLFFFAKERFKFKNLLFWKK